MNKSAEIIEIGIPINDDETGEVSILLRPNEVKLLEKQFKKYSKLQQELQRKDNIINELKKALKDHKEIKNKTNTKEYYIEVDEVLDYIKELESK